MEEGLSRVVTLELVGQTPERERAPRTETMRRHQESSPGLVYGRWKLWVTNISRRIVFLGKIQRLEFWVCRLHLCYARMMFG